MATKTPVTTLLNLETHQALETLSRRDDRSISQIIREAVVKYINAAA
jgi:predicted DNA-binding protein